jgi:hypothetical protein
MMMTSYKQLISLLLVLFVLGSKNVAFSQSTQASTSAKAIESFFDDPECLRVSPTCPFPFKYFAVEKDIYFTPARGQAPIKVPRGQLIKIGTTVPTTISQPGFLFSKKEPGFKIHFQTLTGNVCTEKKYCIANITNENVSRYWGSLRNFTQKVKDDKKPPSLDRSIEWIKPYISCDDYSYLASMKGQLVAAEKTFGVPAPVLACLIARESRWSLRADQFNSKSGRFEGSFIGLQQANAPAFETMRDRLGTVKGSYQWKKNTFLGDRNIAYANQWRKYTGTADFENLQVDKMYIKRGSHRTPQGNLVRCEIRNYSNAEQTRMGQRSIAFVAIHLKQIADMEFQKMVLDARRNNKPFSEYNAKKLYVSLYQKYIAVGAAGYNAGDRNVDDMLPDDRLLADGVNFAPYLLPPKNQSAAKQAEVKQYVGWIDACVDGQYRENHLLPAGQENLGIRPPASGVDLNRLESPYTNAKGLHTCRPNPSPKILCPPGAKTDGPQQPGEKSKAKPANPVKRPTR